MANELTIEQQRAIALANARARASASQSPNQPQTIFTEETVYDPVSGLPLSSPSYGPEATGKTKIAQDVLTSAAALPISVATGVARGSGAARIPQLVERIFTNEQDTSKLGGTNALGQIERGMEQRGGEYLQKGANIVGQAAPFLMGGMGGSPLGTSSIADKAMGFANKIPVLPSYARNILGNAALGGVSAAANPEATMGDVGFGAALGGALPVAGQVVTSGANKLYQGAKSAVEPFYEAGRERILGRALREAAGGEADKAVANLKSYKPSVTGTQLTAGEVSGVPSLAATQRSVMATSPEATNLATARQVANAQARTQALENIASDTRVNKYTNLRNTLGDELYTPALNTAMDFATLSKPLQRDVESLAKTPAIKRAMEKARENALNKNIDIGDPRGSLRGLHETKMALDQEINAVKAKLQRDQAGATSAELEGLKAAKDRLLGFIETVSPEYKAARETYARLSKPVEQLERIKNLADKAVNPKDQQIYAGRFFTQLEALKKEGVLTPRQIQRLEAIADDLRKVDFGQTAGRGVGSDTVQKLAYTNMLKQAGIPSMLQNIPAGQVLGNVVGRAGDVLYGGANRQLTSQLAEALMSPAETARLMEKGAKSTSPVINQQQRNLAKILMMQQLGYQGE